MAMHFDPTRYPAKPGCYLFKNESGVILYVGKAKNLRKRLANYFQHSRHDIKTAQLVKQIAAIDWLATRSEVDALILENNLIKQHQPKYNINLKDAKRYASIFLNTEPFPRFAMARKRGLRGVYFGPFVSSRERDAILKLVNRLFRLRTCRKMPRIPCLRYHIHICSAPCAGHIDRDTYLRAVEQAQKTLQGQYAELSVSLTAEMTHFASQQDFERALERRNQIAAVKKLAEKQTVERAHASDYDILHYRQMGDTVYLVIFNYLRGVLLDKKEFSFNAAPDFFEEFLLQYYSEHTPPRELIVPHAVSPALRAALGKEKPVRVTVPQKGEKKQLLDLVAQNIDLEHFADTRRIEALQDVLGLDQAPELIECVDISHISGTAMVGSLVRFRNGAPDKEQYRRFAIKTLSGSDDFAAIAEVVRRRYTRLLAEKQRLPDLLVIDGGLGQLHAAQAELRAMNLALPLIAIAKREEEIYIPGQEQPLLLSKRSDALKLVQHIRDEAHRFALAYHHTKRSRQLLQKE